MVIFNNQIIRKLIVGFGSIFDNLTLVRYDSSDEEQQRIKVPITYAPKEKYVARIIGDPDLNKKVQITLPRISYDMLGMSYDSARKLQTNIRNISQASATTGYSQFNPVPYNFDFELYLYVRNIEDGNQLIEHILPYFTPEYTLKLNMIPSMGDVREVPILLNSVNYDIEYEGESDSDTRIIIWTLKFTVKAYVYGPVTERKIIKNSIVNIKNLKNIGQDITVSFNMSSSGNGIYKIGESVYQGYSFGLASAKAEVISYSSNTHILKVKNLQGDFKSNTYLYGLDSQAEYIIDSVAESNVLMATANTIVVPFSANANSYFTVNTVITEY